jgi:hypothetical protein
VDGKIQTEGCQDCKRQVAGFDTVNLTLSEKETRVVCTRCFNERIAVQAGVEFDHPTFEPVVLRDPNGAPHEFHFRTRHGGAHIAMEAFELQNGIPGGYEFQVLGDPTQDPLEIFKKLFERMRRALRQKHIEPGELGPQIAKSGGSWVLRGQIDWDPAEEERRLPRLVVDGRSYSWDEIGRMIMSFEGFLVKMDVYDRSEER